MVGKIILELTVARQTPTSSIFSESLVISNNLSKMTHTRNLNVDNVYKHPNFTTNKWCLNKKCTDIWTTGSLKFLLSQPRPTGVIIKSLWLKQIYDWADHNEKVHKGIDVTYENDSFAVFVVQIKVYKFKFRPKCWPGAQSASP